MDGTLILPALGLALLLYRLWPRREQASIPEPATWPTVSIVVPARNEERNLPSLLASLAALSYPHCEIIVVDDGSEDRTAEVARRYPVRLVEGLEKPGDWFGKPWACHQGSLKASGEYLLFTDADTIHEPASLKRAIAIMLDRQSPTLTALPYHLNPKFWERLLGPFQLFLYALTHPYGKPKKGRVFAIGQYLIFHRPFYEKIGGHVAIKSEAVDDLALAKNSLEHGAQWPVHTGEKLYKVRMYESFSDFIKGWRRNFHGGLQHNSAFSSIEVVLFFMAMTTGFLNPGPGHLLISAATLGLFAGTQAKAGRFSIWGVILFPLSMMSFTLASILAVYDRLRSRPLSWKNRSYSVAPTARNRLQGQ